MRRLIYLASAEDDLDAIFTYLARQSSSLVPAQHFVDDLQNQCKKLASSLGTLGVARPNLCAELRSLPFGNYTIFFRYRDDALQIVNILESHRDADRYFRS